MLSWVIVGTATPADEDTRAGELKKMSGTYSSDAEMMARTFGVALGAASCSDNVSNDRLDAAAERMKSVLDAAASTTSEAEAAQDKFSASVVVGRQAVKNGAIAEFAAENALSQLEDDLDDAKSTILDEL